MSGSRHNRCGPLQCRYCRALDRQRPDEPSCPHSLVRDVIPLVEEHGRVIANKDNRASA